MLRQEEIHTLLENGGNVVSDDGSKIGSVGQVFLDDETSQPEWVTVKTGMFGGAESFVPLQQASLDGNDVRVPFDKEKVKDAPRVDDSEGHLSRDQEAELYRYYGLDYGTSNGNRSDVGNAGLDRSDDRGGVAGLGGHDGDRDDHSHDHDSNLGRGAGHDTSGPNTDSAMTRSEEHLDVGTEKVATGKARLRKYVVTENVTKTVPVTREEVRIEREPITDANRDEATAGGDLTSEEHEVELTEDRVVVDKDVVPVERVRLDTDTVTEDHQVDEEVRKEQIETDGVDDPASGREGRR